MKKLLLFFLFSPFVAHAQIFDRDYFNCEIFETGGCLDTKTVQKKPFLYPNPTKDILILSEKGQNTEGVIFNDLGQKVKVVKLENIENFDVSELAQGIYFLQLLPSKIVVKFVKL
jgi:Secretion system C-terminal sorting domain